MNIKTSFRYLFLTAGFVSATVGYGCGTEQKGSVDARAMNGEQLYKRYCKRCHSMEPPPKFGPPIKGLAMHYREAFSDKKTAIEHMVSFMQKPDPARSKCRPEAIERFGLMPAMNIAEEKLRIVSEWVWEQYDPELKQRHAEEHHH